MRKGKKEQPTHYAFESYNSTGAFTKICKDMMNSLAWQKLNLRQRGLYLTMKKKFTKYKDQSTNVDDISMPTNELKQFYGDMRTFRKDIDTLIEYGFVKCIAIGWNTRTCNIYGFSDKWKLYGTDKFLITNCERRKNK